MATHHIILFIGEGLIILLILCLLSNLSRGDEKKKSLLKRWEKGLIVCLLIVTGVLFAIGDLLALLEGSENGVQEGLRLALREPVIDNWRLEGYKVIDKSFSIKQLSFKEPEIRKFWFNLEDTFTRYKVRLNKVEVSEGIFNDEKYKINVEDPNAP